MMAATTAEAGPQPLDSFKHIGSPGQAAEQAIPGAAALGHPVAAGQPPLGAAPKALRGIRQTKAAPRSLSSARKMLRWQRASSSQ